MDETTYGGRTAQELWTLLEEIGGPKTAEWDSIHVHAKAYQAAVDALPKLLGTASRVNDLAALVDRCNDEWYLRCMAVQEERDSLQAALRAARDENNRLKAEYADSRTCPKCGGDLEEDDTSLRDLHYYSRGGAARREEPCRHCGARLEIEEWESAHNFHYVVRELALGREEGE